MKRSNDPGPSDTNRNESISLFWKNTSLAPGTANKIINLKGKTG
jgi:hypothetical protein